MNFIITICKNHFCFLVLVLLLQNAKPIYAQNRIYGKVINAQDESIITNANVFITNTSKGTRTNLDGSFSIEDAPVGNYELVISCVGYNTVTYSYTAKQLPLKLIIKLDIKIQEEETAVVEVFEKDGWSKWGATFLDSYLGTTENRSYCEILNKEVIKFKYAKKENKLIAKATDIIVIKNKKLGYIIKHQLEGFEIDFKEKSTLNYGFPYFEEIETKSKSKNRRYDKARKKAYHGSIMHFMRVLFKDSLAESGFEIRELQKIENSEKVRVRKILQNKFKKISNDSLSKKNTSTTKNIVINVDQSDSGKYYNTIMSQPDYFEVLGKRYTTNDICNIDSLITTNRFLQFPQELYVEYTKEQQDPLFYELQFRKNKTTYQTTRIFYNTTIRTIQIFENGSYFNPLHLFFDGYMAWEKMADLLPLDYEEH
jgi:hypothetical protein